jgi:hypothetical protein
MRHVVALLVAAAAGCALEDKDSGDPTQLDCHQLAAQLRSRAAATSKACTSTTDCEAVGFPQDRTGSPTCDCGIAFAGVCGGDPVNAEAWAADATARNLMTQWTQRCVQPGNAQEAPTICDCGPGGVSCVAQRCASDTLSCFPTLDAGVPPSGG